MSRIHMLESGQHIETTMQHQMQEAMARAVASGSMPDNPIVQPFTFDLIGTIKGITTKRLKDDVLNRLSFSCDAYIAGALSRLLADFYRHSKGEVGDMPTYASYGDFLSFIEGLEASEQSLYETGMDVKPSIERIHNLVQLRNEVHSLIAGSLTSPLTYTMPDLTEYLAKPRLRSLSAAAEAGIASICEDDAGSDEELYKELFDQYRFDDAIERQNQLRMDTMKAKSLIVLYSCIKACESLQVSDEDDAFFTLDARTQFGMLNTTHKAIVDARRKAVTDNRVSVMEKATLRVEAKALMSQIDAALQHDIFNDVQ